MKFNWPKTHGEVRDITSRQFDWLLQGLQIDQKNAHPDSINTNGFSY
jgi:transposase